MTPTQLINASFLSLALALPAVPALATIAPAFPGSVAGATADADTLLIDVKQGRSGTGERGRDRDRDDDDRDDDRHDDRGRGRGSDDNGSRDDNGSGSGRDRPRIPGGSGCDDPEDLIEHPECRP